MHPISDFAPKCTQAIFPSGLYSFCCRMPSARIDANHLVSVFLAFGRRSGLDRVLIFSMAVNCWTDCQCGLFAIGRRPRINLIWSSPGLIFLSRQSLVSVFLAFGRRSCMNRDSIFSMAVNCWTDCKCGFLAFAFVGLLASAVAGY